MTSVETTAGGWRIDHEFKSHPDVFWPAARGEKTFEFRKDDRGGYHVGQVVRLRCYDHGSYVDVPPLDRRITNILRPGEFGLQEGYCILSLAPLSSTPSSQEIGVGEPTIAYEMDERGAWTWIVWAILNDGARLAAIAATKDRAETYRDVVAQTYPGARFFAERAPVNHAFGAADLRSIAGRAAARASRQGYAAPRLSQREG